MFYNRIYSMLVLLLLGGASIVAQDGGDPFGVVNYRKYANNMSLTAFVRMGGQVLGKGTVVATYCGEELRGKDSPMDDGAYTDILYLDIYGDTKGDKLHFKVFTEGRVIEVDQGLTYTSDDIIGSPESPYYIDLPAPIVTNFSPEGWATTCLPFDALVPAGVTVWNATAIKDGDLVTEALQLPTVQSPLGGGAEISILPKGTPALIEVSGQTSCEWLSRVADVNATATGILLGTTEAKAVDANSVLTLGHSKENGDIGFWLFTGTEIPANRAYIAEFPSGTNGARISIDNTSISEKVKVDSDESAAAIYDLQGRRLNAETSSSKATGSNLFTNHSLFKKGHQGQIIIIR